MHDPATAPAPLLVACLCAQCCRTCGEYRPTFDALAGEFGERVHFVWVDIEDDEAALANVDVDDFPTLLIARGDHIMFFGPVTPHPQTAVRLLQRALLGELAAVNDSHLAGLPKRVRALGR